VTVVSRIACLRLAVVLLALAGIGPCLGGDAAQSSGLPDMRWVGPTWGHTVRWFSNEWTVVEDSSSDGTDLLALNDSLGNRVVFQAATEFGGDAEACLDWLLTDTPALANVSDFRLARDEFGDPYLFRSPTQGYAVFSVRVAGDDGVVNAFVGYMECQTLVPGEAVLARIYSGPPQVFAEWYDDIVKTIEGVFLPATGWIADDPSDPAFVGAGIAPLAGEERIDASFVLDAAGRPQLLIGLEAESGATRMVTFENVSQSSLVVVPGDVELTLISFIGAVADRPAPLTSLRWEDGFASDADGTRELAPGERATALLDFAPPDFTGIGCDVLPALLLTYRPPVGASVEFAYGRLPAEFDDCVPVLGDVPVGRPVLEANSAMQPPTETAVTRLPILAAMDGRLDDLGRIPLGRLVLAQNVTFGELPAGDMALYVESGSVEVVLDDVTVQVPAGEQMTADDGADLLVRNTSGGDALLLVLALDPTESWDTWDADDPFRDRTGFRFTPLFPQPSLLDRQAGRQFTVEAVRLAPGAAFTPEPDAGAAERAEVLVESGSVMVRSPDGSGESEPIFVGETARVPAGGSITAAADEPASLLVVYVE
jgi:hypothetical protein